MTTADLVGDPGIVAPPMAAAAGRRIRRMLETRRRRPVRWYVKRAIGLSLLIAGAVASAMHGYWIVPIVLAVYGACGLCDVLRNTPCDLFTVDRYFFGNGIGTWLLSPFNLFIDVLALPYRNRGIHELHDLPAPVRDEVNDLIRSAHESDVIEQLQSRIGDGRSMIFFKWYGRNLSNSIDVPAFHKRYRHIRTIGVSVFNRRQSTSWHYGPLRATYRVLYNLRPAADDAAFIQVGRHVHRWNECPLFIFDDTLMHQSCNETDGVRYCMFIDIVRPGFCPPLMRAIVTGLRCLLLPVRFVFYSRWAPIR